jgi:hypothetical protein
MSKYSYEEIRKFFPLTKEIEIVEKLINKWKKDPSKTRIYRNRIPKNPSYPFYFHMGVIQKDWPGLSTAILGVIHGEGWNVSYESGIEIEIKNKKIGIIILVIEIRNDSALRKFKKDKKQIINNIRNVSAGSLAKRLLLTIESKRLEVYSKVISIIKEICTEDFLPELLGPEGEAFKFFASRTKAYITERKPEDLAEQIVTNYMAQRDIVEKNGKIQIYIRNLKTIKENLTCITVGVYEKDLTLKVILDTISFVLPDSRILYNKEFTNPKGVLVARIEISNKEGEYYPPAYHERIRKVLERIHKKGREDTGKTLTISTGLENYVRAIIPRLIKELEKSGETQVYFSLTNSTEFFLEFKILVVTNKKEAEKKNYKIINGFNKIRGLKLLSTHQPRERGNANLLVFDVKAELDEFEAPAELYQKTKKVLRNVLGKIRDFDEGIREMDSEKIKRVLEDFPKIPEEQIKKLYYSLEDFWRISTPSSDITKILEAIYKLIKKHKKKQILYEKLLVEKGTIIVFVSPKKKVLSGKVLNSCSKFKITLSRIEMTDTNILIAIISKDGKPITNPQTEEIISKVLD